MEFLDLRQIVKRYGWIAVLAMLAGGVSAAYFTSREPVLYEAVATVVIGPTDGIGNAETTLRGLDAISRRNVIATYARIPSSRAIVEGVAKDLALSKEKASSYSIRTSVIPDTNILRITAQGPDPQIAVKFANSSVKRSQEFTPELYDGIVSFKTLDEATVPRNSIESGMSRKIGLGVLFGFLLSFGLAFIIERFHYRNTYGVVQHPVSSQAGDLA